MTTGELKAALVEVFGYSIFQYLNTEDFDAKVEALRLLLIDGHAPGCAVFSVASYHRSSPIPCTCGYELNDGTPDA